MLLSHADYLGEMPWTGEHTRRQSRLPESVKGELASLNVRWDGDELS
jgi:hypothetical protein